METTNMNQETTRRTSRPRQSKFRENLFPVVLLVTACVGIFHLVTGAMYLAADMARFAARLGHEGYTGLQSPGELIGVMLIALAIGAAADRILIHLATRE